MNSNKHLDDLFAAARQEQPVISEENARELLRKAEQVQPASFIYSPKGIIMTTIGLAASAFIGYLALSGSPQISSTSGTSATQVSTPSLASSATFVDQKENPNATQKLLIIPNENGDDVPTPPTPPTPPIPLIPPLPPSVPTPLKVTGIKAVTLAPEKYAKMGISKKDDGTVSFTQKNENGKVFTISFPRKSWGVIIGGDKESTSSDVPSFAPLIVTDSKGNKRLMQFTSNIDGTKMRSMEINEHRMHNDADNDDDNSSNLEDAVNIANIQVGGDDADLDKLTIGNLDSTSGHHVFHKDIRINTNITIDSTGENHSTNNIDIMVNTDSVGSAPGKPKKMVFMKMQKVLRKDSLNSKSEQAVPDAMKEAQIQIQEATNELRKIDLDSIFKEANKAVKYAIEKSQVQMQELHSQIKHLNLDSILQLANEKIKEAMKGMEDVSGSLNRLIPIQVREKTSEHLNPQDGITYDDGLIFWYQPGKDVAAIMPEAADKSLGAAVPTPGNASQVIEEAILYPNPAKNRTSLHFTLSEPRTLAFSIHDLLGKRMMDAGNIVETSSGSFEKELDVSELTAGVYLLVITTDKGEQSMQRLVIEK
ncbi:MAG: T9SS type A sorting domain-containing protein [Bacteroidota bacterium]|nr:T9SS type A sorting domain-containing protein [Bacteroidota bacterium]